MLYIVPRMQTGSAVRGNSSLGQVPLSYVVVLRLAAQERKAPGGTATILLGYRITHGKFNTIIVVASKSTQTKKKSAWVSPNTRKIQHNHSSGF